VTHEDPITGSKSPASTVLKTATACVPPQFLAITSLTPRSVTLQWNEERGGAARYHTYIGNSHLSLFSLHISLHISLPCPLSPLFSYQPLLFFATTHCLATVPRNKDHTSMDVLSSLPKQRCYSGKRNSCRILNLQPNKRYVVFLEAMNKLRYKSTCPEPILVSTPATV